MIYFKEDTMYTHKTCMLIIIIDVYITRVSCKDIYSASGQWVGPPYILPRDSYMLHDVNKILRLISISIYRINYKR